MVELSEGRAAVLDRYLSAFKYVRPANAVTVSFDENLTMTFSISAAAPMAELAERLAREEHWSGRRMTSVIVAARIVTPVARRRPRARSPVWPLEAAHRGPAKSLLRNLRASPIPPSGRRSLMPH